MLILANYRKLSRCITCESWVTLGPTSPTKYKPSLHLIPFKISPATNFGKQNVNTKHRASLFSSLTSLTNLPHQHWNPGTKSPSSTLKPIQPSKHSFNTTTGQGQNLKSHPTWSIINTHHNPWEWEQRSTYYKSHNITMHTYIFLEPYILLIYLYIIKKAIHFYKLFGLISHTSKSTHKQKFMSIKCYIKHPDHTDLVRLAYGIRTREAASDSSGSSLHYSYVPPL